MASQRILLVEDEEDIADLIEYNLSKEGFAVEKVSSGESALKCIQEKLPDLVLLDLMLPGLDGLSVCRLLKQDQKLSSIPIIIVTARGEENDIVTGLELGANDYITKPFSPRLMIARIRNVLQPKPKSEDPDSIVKSGDIEIDPLQHKVLIKGELVELTATEFKLLHCLVKNKRQVFTRQQIVLAVRGADYPVTDRSIDVQVVGLRKKLGAVGEMIETVRGVGYRFQPS